MNDNDFARIVAEDVKNRASARERDYLRLPENWERWQKFLIALVDNLDLQERNLVKSQQVDTDRYRNLGRSGEKLLEEATASYEDRRKRIGRFRFYVESRLDEVTRMIEVGSDEVAEKLGPVGFLRRAIERHRHLLEEYDIEATPIDRALWEALEGRWGFEEIDAKELQSL